jgi:hypothetical protein
MANPLGNTAGELRRVWLLSGFNAGKKDVVMGLSERLACGLQ